MSVCGHRKQKAMGEVNRGLRGGVLCWETRTRYNLSELTETRKASNSTQAMTKAGPMGAKMFSMLEKGKAFTVWTADGLLMVVLFCSGLF